jgi:hypothetical protein
MVLVNEISVLQLDQYMLCQITKSNIATLVGLIVKLRSQFLVPSNTIVYITFMSSVLMV